MPPVVINKKVFGERNAKLKCVFFSAICPEKGVDIILNAAESLPNISFVFYGTLDQDYQTEFRQQVDRLQNVKYYGVFTGDADAVYGELAKYDVLLLPTRWEAEGVPGILVEAKIAGLVEVVSDHNYNTELVNDQMDGVVLPKDNVENLVSILKRLTNDRKLLQQLKRGSSLSAEKFYIENYIEDILRKLFAE